MPNPLRLKGFSRGEWLTRPQHWGAKQQLHDGCSLPRQWPLYFPLASWGEAKSYLNKGQDGVRA